MTINPEIPSFEHFDRLLTSIELELGGSEIQGVICGLLCAGHSDAHVAFFAELFENYPPDDLLVQEARDLLAQLYQVTRDQLHGSEMGFILFLPTEQALPTERARCLAEWCQGFLYGLGLADISERQFPGDMSEALADILEISKLDYERIVLDEAAEADLLEVEEFLRVAVLLIWQELASQRGIADDQE